MTSADFLSNNFENNHMLTEGAKLKVKKSVLVPIQFYNLLYYNSNSLKWPASLLQTCPSILLGVIANLKGIKIEDLLNFKFTFVIIPRLTRGNTNHK